MEYQITVIESDEPASWLRYVTAEQWGSTEPHWLDDGEQVGKNVVRVTVPAESVARFERALERDGDVLSYKEVVP